MLAFLIILGWLQVCILSLSLSSMTIKVPARLAITPLSLRNLLKTHRVKSVQMLMGHLISKAPHIQFPESIIAKV